MFIGRKDDLAFFNERYRSDHAEFIVLYGRRRIGKTELLTEFCRDKPNIFYSCNEYTDGKQLAAFSEAVTAYAPSLYRYMRRALDWEETFTALSMLPGEQKTVIVIDEFPYMCMGNKSIPSVLQNLWDRLLKDANIMLILCGSSMSFMENEILAAKTPLYGRMTGIYKLAPMSFNEASRFFPDYSAEDRLTAYAILGGIPHYLRQFDPGVSLETNTKKQILSKGTVLFGEAEYILHQELREPAVYITLIETIATGCTKFSEICARSGVESSKASGYLKNLKELGIIIHEFPVNASAKERTKRNQGEYHIADDFFRFWFSFVYRYASELAKGEIEDVWRLVIKDRLHDFASKAFENVCIEYLRNQKKTGCTPFEFITIGRWWGNVTHQDTNGKPVTAPEEIDILAANPEGNRFIAGECKFRRSPFDSAQFSALKNKFPFQGDVTYYLFSLSGFTPALREEAAHSEHLKIVTLDEIAGDPNEH